MIKKFEKINNFASFKNFHWDSSVLNNDNTPEDFKGITIIYGRNYSGKTTLSRLISAMENGALSDKYEEPDFLIKLDDGYITQNTLQSHSETFRVFNEDFVKENLKFIIDENESIKSFAILGKNNEKIENSITKLQAEIGTKANETQQATGIYKDLETAEKNYTKDNQSYNNARERLETKLRNHANRVIKPHTTFGHYSYNISSIKKAIAA